MVFCYKFITQSPRRLYSISPRRRSPKRSAEWNKIYPTATSAVINSADLQTEINRDDLGSIPERDWKLLAALARKREENNERDRLADEFRKLWIKEEEERRQVESEITSQYQKYIRVKRDEERRMFEERQLQRSIYQQKQRSQLINSIKYKEMRSADMLAWVDDVKTSDLIEKSLLKEGRATLAARKRARQNALEDWQRHTEITSTMKRSYDAEKRRVARLRDASKRAAISNAFNTWETTFARSELEAMDAAKRASLIQRLAYEDERSNSFLRKRNSQWNRKRKIAAISARLRDAIREHRF